LTIFAYTLISFRFAHLCYSGSVTAPTNAIVLVTLLNVFGNKEGYVGTMVLSVFMAVNEKLTNEEARCLA
jgi:uncharacterized membrane protein YhhN